VPEALNPKNVDVVIPPQTVLHGVSSPEVIKCNQSEWGRGETEDLEQEIGPDNREDDPAEQGVSKSPNQFQVLILAYLGSQLEDHYDRAHRAFIRLHALRSIETATAEAT